VQENPGPPQKATARRNARDSRPVRRATPVRPARSARLLAPPPAGRCPAEPEPRCAHYANRPITPPRSGRISAPARRPAVPAGAFPSRDRKESPVRGAPELFFSGPSLRRSKRPPCDRGPGPFNKKRRFRPDRSAPPPPTNVPVTAMPLGHGPPDLTRSRRPRSGPAPSRGQFLGQTAGLELNAMELSAGRSPRVLSGVA